MYSEDADRVREVNAVKLGGKNFYEGPRADNKMTIDDLHKKQDIERS